MTHLSKRVVAAITVFRAHAEDKAPQLYKVLFKKG